MKRKILVVYQWMHKTGNGIGNVDVTINYNVPTIESIREIERQICELYGFAKVVVINIIELGESEDTK